MDSMIDETRKHNFETLAVVIKTPRMEISRVFVILLEAALPIYFSLTVRKLYLFVAFSTYLSVYLPLYTHCFVDVIANNRSNSGLSSTLPDFEKSWD
jgi:hypothetical protein